LQQEIKMNQTPQIAGISDDSIQHIIDTGQHPLIVEISTDWCVPCRLLRPVMRKLALEFAGKLQVVELDADGAETFMKTYNISSVPQLLCFYKGELVHRERGFNGLTELNKMIAAFLGASSEPDASAATAEFESAFADANSTIDEIMTPASTELEPFFKAIQPVMQALETGISEDLATARITKSEAHALRKAGYARLYEPFKEKVDANREAQERAMTVYNDMMVAAVDRFAVMMRMTDQSIPYQPSDQTDVPAEQVNGERRSDEISLLPR
jgi:thioredoxin-like negative regulator of GroEL